jgi:hypothetical protein
MNRLFALIVVAVVLGTTAFADEPIGSSEFIDSESAADVGNPSEPTSSSDSSGSSLSVGVGGEVNKNSLDGVAVGGAVSVDFRPGRLLAFGVRANVSRDLDQSEGVLPLTTIEARALVRFYVLRVGALAVFAQAEGGVWYGDDGEENSLGPTGAVAAGARLPLGDWYVEGYARGGYPFAWGAGVLVGRAFWFK